MPESNRKGVTEMNFTFKLKLPFNRLFYASLVETEKCIGINSNRKGEDSHFVFMDIDEAKIGDLVIELERQQNKYNMGEIYITTDKEDSYQVWCFKKYPFKKMLEILANNRYTNLPFIKWTARKGCSTMRLSTKEGRIESYLTRLDGDKHKMPLKVEKVLYETAKGRGVKVSNI